MILKTIEKKLIDTLTPIHLEVKDETFMHHGGLVTDTVTHIRVVVVSEMFLEKKILERHRLFQSLLKEELSLIHASSVWLYTPIEWQGIAPRSPHCVG